MPEPQGDAANRRGVFSALVDELRRRRVFQVAGLYLITGSGLIQGAGAVLDALDVSKSLLRWLAVLVVAGFPVAVGISWAYDLRVQREQAAGGVLKSAGARARLLLGGGIVLGMLLLGVVAFLRLSPGEDRAAGDALSATVGSKPVLAVYRLDLVGSAGARPFASVLQQSLHDALAQSSGVTMVSPDLVNSYAPKKLTLDSLATRLAIDYLVSGRATVSDTATQLTVYVVDRSGKEVVPPGTFSAGPLALDSTADLQYLVRKAVDHVLQTVGAKLQAETWAIGTSSMPAVLALNQADHLFDQAAPLFDKNNPAPVRRLLDQADAQLAIAMAADPKWTAPAIRRAELSVWRAVASDDLGQAAVRARLDQGFAIVGRLLRRDPDDAKAVYVQGLLLHHETMRLQLDSVARATALAESRRQLERALQLDPTLAEAAAELTHLLYSEADFADARMYARQALDIDAYQQRAHQLIYQLAMATFESGDESDALRLCREAFRRFDDAPNHHGCVLEVLAYGDSTPDVAEAWRHFDRIRALTEGNAGTMAFYQLAVASVLARAGLRDSAEHVLARAHQEYAQRFQEDPNTLWLEAAARFRMGQTDSAVTLLRAYEARQLPDLKFNLTRRALRPYLAYLDRDVPRR